LFGKKQIKLDDIIGPSPMAGNGKAQTQEDMIANLKTIFPMKQKKKKKAVKDGNS
jgi:hypothetical protein